MKKRIILGACAGLAILALRMYANDATKTPPTTNHVATAALPESTKSEPDHLPFANPEPAVSKQPSPAPVAKPAKLVATPPANTPAPAASKSSVTPQANSAPAAQGAAPAVNFQIQMAQIHQKVFSGFEQSDLMEFGQALEQAFNGALASREFDRGINKLEDAAKELAVAFGKNIEVDRDLNTKIKKAFETATVEFENLIRSGKIADLTGEAYLARILKSALSGLKEGFNKAAVIPENTPVPANLGAGTQAKTPIKTPSQAPKISAPASTVTAPIKSTKS